MWKSPFDGTSSENQELVILQPSIEDRQGYPPLAVAPGILKNSAHEVLLDNYGYIKLIDFGCAARLNKGQVGKVRKIWFWITQTTDVGTCLAMLVKQ